MKNKINSTLKQGTISGKIQNILNNIYDEEIWVKQEMWKVGEITYSYDETKTIEGKPIKINYTLLNSIGGLDEKGFEQLPDQKKKESILRASTTLTKKLIDKKQLMLNGIKEFNYLKQTTVSSEKILELELAIGSFEEKIDLIDYCLNGLPYELEKAGIHLGITKQQIENIDKKQENIDKKVFGEKITENEEETRLGYEQLFGIYQKNKYKLTTKEQQRYTSYLEIIRDLLPKEYRYREQPEKLNELDIFKPYKMNSNKYIANFNFFIESIPGLKHIAVKSKYAGSISDGPNRIEFPITTGEKDIQEILKLNTHEIVSHSINDHNNSQLIGNIRGKGSTEKEEGVAILMEHLLKFGKNLFTIDSKTGKQIINIDMIELSAGFCPIMMGEVLDNNSLSDFLELSNKLETMPVGPKKRFDRVKRSNKNRVQRKDVSYMRGFIKIVKLINLFITTDGKEGINPNDLFLGKVGIDDIVKLKAIKQEKENKGGQLDLIKPSFSSEAILYILQQREQQRLTKNKKENKISMEGFINFLQDRYPIFDFSHEIISESSQTVNRNILAIVKTMENTMNDQKKEKTDEEKITDFIRIQESKLDPEKIKRIEEFEQHLHTE